MTPVLELDRAGRCWLCRAPLAGAAPATYDGYPIDQECADALHVIHSVSLAWVHPHGPTEPKGEPA